MIVLGIDSSTDCLAVALSRDRKITAEKAISARQEQASRIIELIDDLLRESKTERGNIDGLAVAIGPGSFTGLRIGLAVAKGMAFALQKPLIGISTFEIVGQRLLERYPRFVLTELARKGEYYFCRVDEKTDIVSAIEIVSGRELAGKSGGWPIGLIGRQPDDWPPTVINPIPLELTAVSAGELAIRGEILLEAGKSDDAASLVPLYLALSQAEVKHGRF